MAADWTRLSQFVRNRREELGLTQTEAVNRAEGGVSLATWRNIETGFRPPWRRAGLLAVCRVLRWTPESFELILEGGEPELLELRFTPTQEEQLIDLQRQIDELRDEFRKEREEPGRREPNGTSKSA